MGKIVTKNLPCLSCSSSDARQIYEDGSSFCFSCQKFFPAQEGEVEKIVRENEKKATKTSIEEIKTFPMRGFRERNIAKEISEFFGVRVSYGENGEIDTHYYPYGDNSFQVRKLPKEFFWINKVDNLFGKDKFTGGGKRVVITEGVIDAMAIAQMYMDKYNKIYPVVAMTSSSSHKQLLENREWLRSFNEVVLCLDMDEPGQKATMEAVRIIGVDKVKIAKLPCKDPSQVYLEKGGNVLSNCIFDAEQYVPVGILRKDELWEAVEIYNKIPSIDFPPCMSSVNKKTKGRRLGEITLFISGTGSGKSTLMREIIMHSVENELDPMIGIVALEESPAETTRKLCGMAINKNPANEEIPIEELRSGFEKVFGTDRIMVMDHQGSVTDSSLMDKLEYMCLCGCTMIIIDHITILVSEGVENLKGLEAQDKTMNDLLRLVKKHPVWIGLVSHLRKAPVGGKSFEEGKLPSLDDIRGSGSVKQISFDVIAFARDMTAKEDRVRNHIRMRVLKCRYTGLTGDVLGADYDYYTGRLRQSSQPIDADDQFTHI